MKCEITGFEIPDDLDTKNGIPFEAETEYLYQKKIAELEGEVFNLKKDLMDDSFAIGKLTDKLAIAEASEMVPMEKVKVLIEGLEAIAGCESFDEKIPNLEQVEIVSIVKTDTLIAREALAKFNLKPEVVKK